MADLNVFINQYSGQYLSVTGPDSGECTAVAHRWEQLCGTSIVYGNAIDTLANAGTDYDKFQNTPSAVPQLGDIMVFGPNSSIGTGSFGHTSVFVSGDANSFTSFDQNWPTGSPCRLIKHNSYAGVIGWFRPKGINIQGDTAMQNDVPVTVDEMRIVHTELEGWPFADTHAGKFDAQFQASWGGHGLREMVWEKWNKNGPWRAERVEAIAEHESGRINSLQSQVDALNDTVKAKDATIADLQTHVAVTNSDTDLLNSFGKVLAQLIARLGLKQ